MSEPFATSETEGAGAEPPVEAPAQPEQTESLSTPEALSEHELVPANAAAPPPPPEPANSDVEGEPRAGTAAQEWPLAWLRLVEPEPPPSDDEVVAAVSAAEPADADGVAHAFGRAMAAALDPEPAAKATEASEAAPEQSILAFYSIPVVEPLVPSSSSEIDEAAETGPAAEAEEAPVIEPDEPALVTPAYVARAYRARRPEPRAESILRGRPGEGAPAAAAYLFYLASFLLAPALAGAIVAQNARRSAPDWLESHYLFLIRTFWIGLAGAAVVAALLFSGKLTLLGLVLWPFLVLWLVVRSAVGFVELVKLRSFARPRTWLF